MLTKQKTEEGKQKLKIIYITTKITWEGKKMETVAPKQQKNRREEKN